MLGPSGKTEPQAVLRSGLGGQAPRVPRRLSWTDRRGAARGSGEDARGEEAEVRLRVCSRREAGAGPERSPVRCLLDVRSKLFPSSDVLFCRTLQVLV